MFPLSTQLESFGFLNQTPTSRERRESESGVGAEIPFQRQASGHGPGDARRSLRKGSLLFVCRVGWTPTSTFAPPSKAAGHRRLSGHATLVGHAHQPSLFRRKLRDIPGCRDTPCWLDVHINLHSSEESCGTSQVVGTRRVGWTCTSTFTLPRKAAGRRRLSGHTALVGHAHQPSLFRRKLRDVAGCRDTPRWLDAHIDFRSSKESCGTSQVVRTHRVGWTCTSTFTLQKKAAGCRRLSGHAALVGHAHRPSLFQGKLRDVPGCRDTLRWLDTHIDLRSSKESCGTSQVVRTRGERLFQSQARADVQRHEGTLPTGGLKYSWR